MNSNCNSCDAEADCAYEYKPCDCCNYRKFVPKPVVPTEAEILPFIRRPKDGQANSK